MFTSPAKYSFIADNIRDKDRDTGIYVEQTADDDTIRFYAGGVQDIVKITSTGLTFNDDQLSINARFRGGVEPNILFIDGVNNAAGFGTDDPTFIREGTNKPSRFGVLKGDAAGSQAGFFAVSSSTPTLAADVSFLKSGGSWGAKTALAVNHVIANLGFEGHDGTDFNRSAQMRVQVDGAVSANTVPMSILFITSPTNDSGSRAVMRLWSNQNVVLNNAAVATNATTGFLHIATCAGTPTGTPTTYSGRVPMVFDTTNNRLYIYNGGWISSAFA